MRAPVVENPHQSTLFDQIFDLILKGKSDPRTIERSLYRQILLAKSEVPVHFKIESTVRYLSIEMDDALAIAEQVDV